MRTNNEKNELKFFDLIDYSNISIICEFTTRLLCIMCCLRIQVTHNMRGRIAKSLNIFLTIFFSCRINR
jgi:hypothetical protein